MAERFFDGKFVGHWTTSPAIMSQTTGFAQFMNEMESVQLSEGMDVWHSKLDADGRFTVGH